MAWLYRQKDSKFWWLGWRVGKKCHFRSTKTEDRAKAEKELAKVDTLFRAHKAGMLEEVYQSISGRQIVRHTLKGAVDEWLAEVKQERGDEATLERYENIAGEFSKFLGATADKPKLSEISTEQVRSYLNYRRTKCSASTTNLERKILSDSSGEL